jgi:hypothetical protein
MCKSSQLCSDTVLLVADTPTTVFCSACARNQADQEADTCSAAHSAIKNATIITQQATSWAKVGCDTMSRITHGSKHVRNGLFNKRKYVSTCNVITNIHLESFFHLHANACQWYGSAHTCRVPPVDCMIIPGRLQTPEKQRKSPQKSTQWQILSCTSEVSGMLMHASAESCMLPPRACGNARTAPNFDLPWLQRSPASSTRELSPTALGPSSRARNQNLYQPTASSHHSVHLDGHNREVCFTSCTHPVL